MVSSPLSELYAKASQKHKDAYESVIDEVLKLNVPSVSFFSVLALPEA